MDVAEFDFDLPPGLIAQVPPESREGSRLLRLPRRSGPVEHRMFGDLPDLLQAGDLIVLNNTRVFPARLLGHRVPSGGNVEFLLVRRAEQADHLASPDAVLWEALVHPGQKLKPGARVDFGAGESTLHAEVLERRFFGRRLVRLWTDGPPVDAVVDAIGHVPLPPYIKREDASVDRERYQTVFAAERGSVAAPTAGLHFSRPLLSALQSKGVETVELTLHVGYGTFQPVRVDRVEEHRLDAERYQIDEHTAASINQAVDEGRRVISVGTTTTRTLEAVALLNGGRMRAGAGETDLFIYPGFPFQVVQGLVTNFHLPRSSLLMLVAALAGRERVLAAYHEAIERGYRFYSYGDAMLIL